MFSLDDRLEDLSKCYPSKLSKKTFTEIMNSFRIHLNLNSEQINEFFNMLTNEGKNEIVFGDIVGLIHFIDEKRRENEEILPFNLTSKQFEFLNNNVKILSSFDNKVAFKSEFTALLKKTNYDFEEWNDDIFEEIFLLFHKYFHVEKKVDHFQFLENSFLVTGTEKSSNRPRKTSQVKGNSQFIDDSDYLKKQLNYFIKKFQELKKDTNIPSLNSLVNDFIIFYEIFEEKIHSFKENFLFYDNLITKQKNEVFSMQEDFENTKIVMGKIQNENNYLRTNNQQLISEKTSLKEELKIKEELYKNKKKELESLRDDFTKYEEDLNESKILLYTLTKEKEDLNYSLKNIETTFDSKKEMIEEKLKKEVEVKIKDAENLKINEIEQLNFQIIKLKQKISSQKKEISYLKTELKLQNEEINFLVKEKEELVHINDNQRQSIQNLEYGPNRTSNLQGLNESIFSNLSNDASIISMELFHENESKIKTDSLPRKESDKVVYTKNVVSNFSNINNIITQKKNDVRRAFPSFFKDFVYICESKSKKLYFLVYKKNSISFFQAYNNKKVHLNFEIEFLETINVSKNNSFLMELVYKNGKKIKSIVLESPNIEAFYESLLLNKNLQNKCVSNLEFLDIENNPDFNMSSINIFPNCDYKGFVRLWVNNIFYNWKIYYFVLVDSNIIKIRYPETFYYSQTKEILKEVQLYRLENFNVMKSKDLKNSPNIFALKLINENIDLIIALNNSYLLKEWLDSLYKVFDNN